MKLRFDDWMHRCLFDPQRGYYTRQVKEVGTGGDFTTTPQLSGALGRGIARWIKEEWAFHGMKLPIIELGAGSGALSLQVREELGWRGRLGLRHGIVEVSEGLQRLQEEKLGVKAHWFGSVSEALAQFNGAALIFSNEFVDAFPVRIFKRSGEGWQELFLNVTDGVVTEEWECAETLPASHHFSHDWAENQRVEVHESYQTYLKDEFQRFKIGSMLTVDYGAETESLYERRPLGSMRGYFMQERVEGALIYQNMGRQDLTADVNFSDLKQWSEDLGLGDTELKTQAEFLSKDLHAEDPLQDELGAGNAFKVMLQRKKSLLNFI